MSSTAVQPTDQSPKRSLPREREDLEFRPSADATLGVELELMLLDRETGDLAPGAMRILQACADNSIEGVSAELVQTMIEIKTGICRNVGQVRQQLVPLARQVRNIARSMGYELALSGTHPFHRAARSPLSPSPRYNRIFDRLAYLVQQRVVFGLHVHVGVPSGDLAIGIINRMVQYLPHLIALSANSPFWEGIDSGLASCRTALFGSLPHAGVPRYFARWDDFRDYFQVMHDCGAIATTKDIYWDIRPRPEPGTVEFRVCDMPPTLSEALRIVAFLHAMVVRTQRELEAQRRPPRGEIRRHWIAVENKWLATRYGMEAPYIRTPAGKQRPLSDDLAEWIEKLAPLSRELGDGDSLGNLKPVDAFVSGSERQRRIYRETGGWPALIADMIQGLSQELDAPSAAAPQNAGSGPPVASAMAATGDAEGMNENRNRSGDAIGDAGAPIPAEEGVE